MTIFDRPVLSVRGSQSTQWKPLSLVTFSHAWARFCHWSLLAGLTLSLILAKLSNKWRILVKRSSKISWQRQSHLYIWLLARWIVICVKERIWEEGLASISFLFRFLRLKGAAKWKLDPVWMPLKGTILGSTHATYVPFIHKSCNKLIYSQFMPRVPGCLDTDDNNFLKRLKRGNDFEKHCSIHYQEQTSRVQYFSDYELFSYVPYHKGILGINGRIMNFELWAICGLVCLSSDSWEMFVNYC